MLLVSAGCALLTAGMVWLSDPGAPDGAHAEAIAQRTETLSLRRDKVALLDVSQVLQQPIFQMTTGPAPYRDKPLIVSGLAISSHRHAVLVSVNGEPARWLGVGDAAGDITVLDVSPRGATFDTPTGARLVTVSVPPPLATDDEGQPQSVARPPLAPPGD